MPRPTLKPDSSTKQPPDIADNSGGDGAPNVGASTDSNSEDTPARTFWQVVRYLAAYRLVYLAMVCLAGWMLPNQYNEHIYLTDYHVLAKVPQTMARFFITWDSEHYVGISIFGYQPGSENQAFYPLWPLIMRGGSYILGGPIAAGVILANTICVFAVAGLFMFLQNRFGRRTAELSILLLLAMPGAIFFAFPYSESLCLALSVWALISLDRGKYPVAGIAALLAALARPVGVFWVLVFAGAAWQKRDRRLLGLCLFPFAGYCAFLLILHSQTGNAFGQFAAIHAYANGASPMNLVDLPGFWRALTNVGAEHVYGDSPIDRLFFVWLAGTLYATYRRDKMLFMYSIAFGLLPAVLTHFISYSRYVVLAFPMLVVTADYFKPDYKRPYFLALLVGLFMLQMIFLVLHINNNWAG